MPNGVDLSSNNGNINWKLLAADMDFAWVKATEGRSYINPSFASDLKEARAAGIAVGAYHYARPDNNNAAAEATHFLNVYRPQPGDLLPVLDLEVHADLSGAGMTAWAATWMELVKQGLNAEVVLYTYPYFISGDMGGAGALKGTKLWYADYSGKPWKFLYKDKAANFNIVAHQYTSSGNAGGVSGRVDLNYAPDLGPILQTPPRPTPQPHRGRLPGPARKPKWFWEALKVYLANRKKV
jgi:GH25 family lysozyme M1 (1,4-beta-N-acetylmuramidase)